MPNKARVRKRTAGKEKTFDIDISAAVGIP
jgi:hypothetical protein